MNPKEVVTLNKQMLFATNIAILFKKCCLVGYRQTGVDYLQQILTPFAAKLLAGFWVSTKRLFRFKIQMGSEYWISLVFRSCSSVWCSVSSWVMTKKFVVNTQKRGANIYFLKVA